MPGKAPAPGNIANRRKFEATYLAGNQVVCCCPTAPHYGTASRFYQDPYIAYVYVRIGRRRRSLPSQAVPERGSAESHEPTLRASEMRFRGPVRYVVYTRSRVPSTVGTTEEMKTVFDLTAGLR